MPGRFTFYTDSLKGSLAEFTDGEYNHMVKVTRFNLGDSIEFTNGKGQIFRGKLIEINKKNCFVEIQETIIQDSPKLRIAMGILKNSDRMEWAVEKCTELGIGELIFLHTKNSERSKINLERLTKTAISAIKQSHTSYLPRITDQNFKDFIQSHSVLEMKDSTISKFEVSQKYIAFCDMDAIEQAAVIKGITLQMSELMHGPKDLKGNDLILIGPEGDFTTEEVMIALENGFRLLNLGTRILRSETAVVSVCALANQH
jgi:16S rRNA (uracil1498-N3)-methyltransferase